MIVKAPNQVLITPAKKVVKIDKKIMLVIDRMKKILTSADSPKGVGLAAPQIGVSLRIFITRPTEKSEICVFLNPEITWYSRDLSEIQRDEPDSNNAGHEKKLEGCLSITNVWGYLKRSSRVRMRYMDINSRTVEKEFSGFMATIVQHETDHLNGILFTKRVMEQKQKLYNIEKTGKGEEKLVEIEL